MATDAFSVGQFFKWCGQLAQFEKLSHRSEMTWCHSPRLCMGLKVIQETKAAEYRRSPNKKSNKDSGENRNPKKGKCLGLLWIAALFRRFCFFHLE
jgi:hypothetical protein